MTPSRTIDQDVRHDPGGSIDIDFCRARAIELRGEAMRDVRMVRATCVGLLTILGVLAIVVLAAAPATPMPIGTAAAAVRASHATE